MLFVFLLVASVTKGQIVPENYAFSSDEDYRRYEQQVIENIKWIATTPRSLDQDNRQQVEDFLVKWVYGCPYVRVIIEPYAMKLSSKNANLLLSFMFGYTLYKLEHLDDKNILNANVAGVSALLDDYQANKLSFKVDPAIDEVAELRLNGKLSEWIAPKLSEKR